MAAEMEQNEVPGTVLVNTPGMATGPDETNIFVQTSDTTQQVWQMLVIPTPPAQDDASSTAHLRHHVQREFDAMGLPCPTGEWDNFPAQVHWFPALSRREYVRKCSHCGRMQQAMQKCGRCKQALYCSKECQRAAWPEHKKTCVPPK